jgi:hypothetical protein
MTALQVDYSIHRVVGIPVFDAAFEAASAQLYFCDQNPKKAERGT